MTNGAELVRKVIQEQNQEGEEAQQAGSGTEMSQESEDLRQQEQEKGYEFRNPLLKGRTPEEIESIFEASQNAIREQGARLSATERRMSELESSRREPEPEVSSEDFYNDPVKAIRAEMERTVAPLKQEISEAKQHFRSQGSRQSMKSRFKDWDVVEPWIDQLLSMQNYPDPNDPGLLETLYYTAKGYMMSNNIQVQGGAPGETRGSSESRVPPPQHRASTPPPPPANKGEPQNKLRELTEHEKRLAREAGMTAEQYIKWQEMDQDEVAEASFDVPKEGQ